MFTFFTTLGPSLFLTLVLQVKIILFFARKLLRISKHFFFLADTLENKIEFVRLLRIYGVTKYCNKRNFFLKKKNTLFKLKKKRKL